MAKRTILLVFIHGFKGNDNTFGNFPDHFRSLIQNALPKVNVLSLVYPQFETRGDLTDCVARFKEWLQNKVIDIEVAANTPSPTVDPSVRVVLIGHSMGGIVAAETLLSLVRDQPVPASASASTSTSTSTSSSTCTSASASTLPGNRTNSNPTTANNSTINLKVPVAEPRASSVPPQEKPPPPNLPKDEGEREEDNFPDFLFPYIQSVLAFDTPYLGIHPGVVAHGAETHYNTASSAMSAYTQASRFFGGGASSAPAPASPSAAALPAPNTGAAWGKWGKYAMGAAAVAAAGGAAWKARDHITKGWAWAGSHLEFIGCLARGAELNKRIEAVANLSRNHNIIFTNFYTCLDKDKQGKTYYSEQLLGEERTFCVVPMAAKSRDEDGSPAKKRKIQDEGKKQKDKGRWVKCINEKAASEIAAHVAMFTPKDNPDYFAMADRAKEVLVGAVDTAWYEASGQPMEGETVTMEEDGEPQIPLQEEQAGAGA